MCCVWYVLFDLFVNVDGSDSNEICGNVAEPRKFVLEMYRKDIINYINMENRKNDSIDRS